MEVYKEHREALKVLFNLADLAGNLDYEEADKVNENEIIIRQTKAGWMVQTIRGACNIYDDDLEARMTELRTRIKEYEDDRAANFAAMGPDDGFDSEIRRTNRWLYSEIIDAQREIEALKDLLNAIA